MTVLRWMGLATNTAIGIGAELILAVRLVRLFENRFMSFRLEP
jgi:hypothetical protein